MQVVDVFGNVEEWGNFGNSPKSYVDELKVVNLNNNLLVTCDFANCRFLSKADIFRRHISDNSSQCLKNILFDSTDRFYLSYIDSSAVLTESYLYMVDVYDRNQSKVNRVTYLYGGLPAEFELSQNFPNPFNPLTNIEFTIPGVVPVEIDLTVYNVVGQKVKTLRSGKMNPGRYLEQWDGRNDQRQMASSGVYMYKLTAGNISDVKKMVLLK
jgi:hypothetical protein